MTTATALHVAGQPTAQLGTDTLEVPPPTPVEALSAIEPLLQFELDPEHDWWQPLKIDLALRWMTFEHARRIVDELHTRDVSEVEVRTSRPGLWRALDGHLGVRVRPRTLTSTAEVVRGLAGPERGELLKLWGLDTRVRRAAARLRPVSASLDSGRWIGLVEIPTPSMSESVLRVAAGARTGVVACDPRVLSVAHDRGLPAVDVWRMPTDGPLPHLAARVREALQGFDPRFATAVAPGLARTAARLSADQIRLRRWFEKIGPEGVFMASDQHRYGVLTVWEARRLGIETLVLQHGLVAHPLGYLPLRADRLAALGPESRDWFVANGTDPGSVVPTGSPRFPELRDFRREPRPRRLLVPLNANMHHFAARILEVAAEVAPTDGRIVVRPHPGERALAGLGREDLLQALRVRPDDVFEIDRSGSLSDALDDVDVVVAWDSTVIYEALAAGVPTVLFSGPDRDSNPLAESGLATFSDAAELAQLLSDSWPAVVQGSISARSRLISAGGDRATSAVVELVQR